jgi:hypothetical protein
MLLINLRQQNSDRDSSAFSSNWRIKLMAQSMTPHLMDHAYEIMAQALEDIGLKLEQHFRVTDQGAALTREAVEAIYETGFPRSSELAGNDSLEGIGLDRDPFWHQLSDYMPENREYINAWAAISITISVAQGWDSGNQEVAQNHLETMIRSVAPTLDLETLQRRSRYDDRALLQLASYAQRGFTAMAQNSAK